MSNHKNISRKLCRAVSSWLLYEFSCNRAYLCNEKYLSLPIGNLLNTISQFNVRTELNHPCQTIARKGRPLQVDYVIRDEHITRSKEWKLALETKWIGKNSITRTSALWDLIRLQNLFTKYDNIRCFFLIAGIDKHVSLFNNKFDFLSINKKNKFNPINVNETKITFQLNRFPKSVRQGINKNIKKYPEFKLYSKIVCKSAAYYPIERRNNMSFSSSVIEIIKPDPTLAIKEIEV